MVAETGPAATALPECRSVPAAEARRTRVPVAAEELPAYPHFAAAPFGIAAGPPPTWTFRGRGVKRAYSSGGGGALSPRLQASPATSPLFDGWRIT